MSFLWRDPSHLAWVLLRAFYDHAPRSWSRLRCRCLVVGFAFHRIAHPD